MTDQLPPHNEQAEWMLLACAIENPRILGSMDESLFYSSETKTTFEAVQRQSENLPSAGVFAVVDDLNRQGFYHVRDAVFQAANDLPSPAGWEYWLDLASEYQQAREAGAIAAELHGDSSPNLTDYASRLQQVAARSKTRKCQTVSTGLQAVIDELESAWLDPESLYGIRTGFGDFDQITHGLKPGEMIVVAARPATGKSAFILNIVEQVSVNLKLPVAMFSLEMTQRELLKRFSSSLSRVPLSKFYQREITKDDQDRFTAAIATINKAKPMIFDTVSDIADICREASKAVLQHGCRLIVIDYLQRVQIRGDKEGRFIQVGKISNAIKNLALQLKVPVLVAAQLNREVEKEHRRPVASDLRDSGMIEQDADVLAMLHCDPITDRTQPSYPVELVVVKNRNGRIGKVDLQFFAHLTRFESAAKERPV